MTGALDPRAPVIVGVGQAIQRPNGFESSQDPISLAVAALRSAGEDSGVGEKLLRGADSIGHVATISWPYQDEAALIAQELGAAPRQTVRTTLFGGDGPVRLLGDTARAIADGELDVALISGAETGATMTAAHRAGGRPPWLTQDAAVRPNRTVGFDRPASNEPEVAVGLIPPLYNYALLETAVRAAGGLDEAEHMRSVASLWAGFSEVAASNPYAWLPQATTADELLEPGRANRPVAAPYLKLMTANIQVDQASGLIMCSAERAAQAGVPRDRWVFVHAVAHAYDEWFMSERAELAASPAIRAAGRAALAHAGASIEDLAHVDLYSCFPSAVQIGARELGLDPEDSSRPLTVTGGLTFAGGPGNNYAGHAVAALVGRLREDPGSVGMGTALGWYVTKHAIGIYSTSPPAQRFAEIDATPLVDRPPSLRATSAYSGRATIEAYTVPFGRDGSPEAAILSALAPDGTRALVRSAEGDVIGALLAGDAIGRAVTIADGVLELTG
jgi:acetyl-CoA C-acetyltransferase